MFTAPRDPNWKCRGRARDKRCITEILWILIGDVPSVFISSPLTGINNYASVVLIVLVAARQDNRLGTRCLRTMNAGPQLTMDTRCI